MRVSWGGVLVALGCLHAGIGLARVPHDVVGQRLAEVRACRAEGDTRYLFRTAFLRGAAAVERLRTTPADSVILFRGDGKGALEFAPALLWPRLLVHADRVPPEATTYSGRRIARLPSPGGRFAQAVLVGEGKALRLETR
ncbi:MAG: hypothetical protein IT458_00480 [Planctomycetes bacterium]|nr:hypothetical protein [Planctomycetota bacterium]